ncbi:MAG TPA: cytochrome c oxidase subunit II [Pirellulales bacterium]|nr:cytochrome c oxidase subunit II [Pirellulales bacterium]
MGKFWSILFLMVPVLGIALFFWAPSAGYWLPRDNSVHGYQIDHLFNFILVLTGVVFAATEGALFWFVWRYDAATNRDPIKFTHGSHNLEVIWTILPAATLLFIAIYQMNAWADVKMRVPKNLPPTVEVTARQFEWRLRYPGPDGKLGTMDDIHHVNDMHLPAGEEVLIELKSMDVLHDLFLPHLRVKQDAVPGMSIPVWFRAKDVGTFDLVCAELCGWGHYKMKGRATIQSRAEYDKWLEEMAVAQAATQEPEKEEE